MMNRKDPLFFKIITILLVLAHFLPSLPAQTTLDIERCIAMARQNAPNVKRAQYEYKDAALQYRIYRKSLLPTLSIAGSLPAINRTISKITLPDGSESFVSQFTGNYSASLNLNQPIPFTGG